MLYVIIETYYCVLIIDSVSLSFEQWRHEWPLPIRKVLGHRGDLWWSETCQSQWYSDCVQTERLPYGKVTWISHANTWQCVIYMWSFQKTLDNMLYHKRQKIPHVMTYKMYLWNTCFLRVRLVWSAGLGMCKAHPIFVSGLVLCLFTVSFCGIKMINKQ